MESNVYPVVRGFIVFCVMIVVLLMMLRLVFNFTDPNPFGKIGRFSYYLKKRTDRFVYPVSKLLARMKLDTRLSPLIAVLAFIVAGYFTLQLFFYLFFTIDGVVASLINPSITRLVGFLLFGFLNLYSIMIVIRIILSWITSSVNRFSALLIKLTDPVLVPFRRIIPPLGMFDISPIVVLILLSFLQSAVAGVLLN